LGFHLAQLCLPPRTHRLPQHREPTLARLPATVREAEEVESLRRSSVTATPSVLPRVATELDESRLLGMQFKAKAHEALAQLGQEPFGIYSMLEPHDKVIGIAHDDHIA